MSCLPICFSSIDRPLVVRLCQLSLNSVFWESIGIGSRRDRQWRESLLASDAHLIELMFGLDLDSL